MRRERVRLARLHHKWYVPELQEFFLVNKIYIYFILSMQRTHSHDGLVWRSLEQREWIFRNQNMAFHMHARTTDKRQRYVCMLYIRHYYNINLFTHIPTGLKHHQCKRKSVWVCFRFIIIIFFLCCCCCCWSCFCRTNLCSDANSLFLIPPFRVACSLRASSFFSFVRRYSVPFRKQMENFRHTHPNEQFN